MMEQEQSEKIGLEEVGIFDGGKRRFNPEIPSEFIHSEALSGLMGGKGLRLGCSSRGRMQGPPC
jgi:hypothetical protein